MRFKLLLHAIMKPHRFIIGNITFPYRNGIFCKIIILVVLLVAVSVGQTIAQQQTYHLTVETRNASSLAYNKGCKLLNENLAKESIPYFVKAIHTDSTLYNPYKELFDASLITQNYSDSVLNCFYMGRKVFNTDNNLCYYIGEMFRLRKQFHNAIEEYTKAIQFSYSDSVKPKNYIRYYSGRAFCHLKRNAYSLALSDYMVYLAAKPDDPAILVNRGICYHYLNDDAKARIDWLKASKLGYPTADEYLKRLNQK